MPPQLLALLADILVTGWTQASPRENFFGFSLLHVALAMVTTNSLRVDLWETKYQKAYQGGHDPRKLFRITSFLFPFLFSDFPNTTSYLRTKTEMSHSHLAQFLAYRSNSINVYWTELNYPKMQNQRPLSELLIHSDLQHTDTKAKNMSLSLNTATCQSHDFSQFTV